MGSVVDTLTGGYGAAGVAAQQSAAHDANAKQEQMYNQTREDLSPYREAGQNAINQMQDPAFQKSFTMADFQADPGYAFRMQEGQKALERSAAARGTLNGGATLKALTRYSQGVASDEFGNAYNRFTNDQNNRFGRLSTLAGMGQNSAAQTGAAGQNYANAYGQNVTGAANAQAAYGMNNLNTTMQLGGMALGAYGGAHGWFK